MHAEPQRCEKHHPLKHLSSICIPPLYAAIPLGSRPSRSPILAKNLEKREEAKTNERVTEYDRITRQETPMTAYDRADREKLMEKLINLPRSKILPQNEKRPK